MTEKFSEITELEVGTERPTTEYVEELEKKANFLEALYIVGVDNWYGYSLAYEAAREYGLEIE